MSTFSHKRFVYFKDTDAAGIVYFGRFYDFAHEALEEHLEAEGQGIPEILKAGEYLWPITRSECRYTSPVRLNDRLDVTGQVKANGDNGIRTDFTITNETTGKEAAIVTIEHTFISANDWKKVSIPDDVRKLMA